MKIFCRMMLIAVLSIAAWSTFGDSLATAPATVAAATETEDSPATARRRACVERCDVTESNCSSSVRRATKQCMKSAATGGIDPWTRRREYAGYYCGFFRGDHCGGAYDRQRCLNRYALRLSVCTDWFRDNTASQYFDCRSSERESLVLCRDELRDCHAACDE